MNYVILIGRLTKDPEKRSTQGENSVSVSKFTLAVQRPFKNVNGEYDCDFIPCVTYRVLADNTSIYCHKGSLVAVRGRLNVRNYEDENKIKHYVTEVMAEKVIFLDNKNKETTKKVEKQEDPYSQMGEEVELEESDLPFDFN